jgi:hypothetical protein
MADQLSLHILRRGDLKSANCYAPWDDPDRIASPTPEKLRTLLENPLTGDDQEPIQIIGLSGKRVIGRIDLIAGSISIAGQPKRIFWSSHLYVPPEFRKMMMGVMLIMKAGGVFGPSQAALPIYQKLKWLDLPLTRYISIVRSRAVMQRYVGEGVAAKVFSVLADVALGMHRLMVAAWRSFRARGLKLSRVSDVPADFDERFAARPEPVQVHRSAKYLRWQLAHRFTDEPRNSNSLYLVQDRNGRTVAYFLNKIRFHETATHRGFKNVLLGSMQDWMVFDSSALGEKDLLLLSARELVAGGVDAIDFCTADPSLAGTLRLMGFKGLGALHLMVKAAGQSPLDDPKYRDLGQWWIRPGDGDNFFV